jgi:hypothetical protein
MRKLSLGLLFLLMNMTTVFCDTSLFGQWIQYNKNFNEYVPYAVWVFDSHAIKPFSGALVIAEYAPTNTHDTVYEYLSHPEIIALAGRYNLNSSTITLSLIDKETFRSLDQTVDFIIEWKQWDDRPNTEMIIHDRGDVLYLIKMEDEKPDSK